MVTGNGTLGSSSLSETSSTLELDYVIETVRREERERAADIIRGWEILILSNLTKKPGCDKMPRFSVCRLI